MPSPVETRLNFALAASERAEAFVLEHYLSTSLDVELKSDESPVTIADRGAEQMLRKEILKEFPNDAVLGEEFGETSGTSGYRWVLDPVDGTKSFVHGVPLFGMLIGLQHNGESLAGICRLPGAREVIYAMQGGGAWWSRGGEAPVEARVRTDVEMSDSLFCYTAIDGFEQIGRIDVLRKLSQKCRLTRGWGDCYGHMLVATGRAGIMVDPLLAEWDACALLPIIREAGGVFMDWTGVARADGGNGISLAPQLRESVEQIVLAR